MAKYIEDVTESYTSLKEIYYKRLSYWDTMRMQANQYRHITDFNFGEKYLYGRVDPLYNPVAVKPSVLRQFRTSPDPRIRPRAVNFVVAAFADMAAELKIKVLKKQISATDPHLSNFTVYKAYENPKRIYSNYINMVYDVMKADLGNNNIQLRNFSDFINKLYSNIEFISREQPFTYPAFIKSRFCPPNASGLAIEIAPADYNNDQEKYQNFVQSENWQMYVELCNKYGFMIDQNAPWRMVADIQSRGMRAYAAAHGIPDRNDARVFFRMDYEAVYINYFNSFRVSLLNLYNRFRPLYISESRLCTDGTIKNTISSPDAYKLEDLERLYGEEYFVTLYFRIRLLEEESLKTAREKELFLQDCLRAYRSKGASLALMMFERILNLPIDYVGSFNYNNKRKKLIADIEAEQKGATILPSSYSTTGGGY